MRELFVYFRVRSADAAAARAAVHAFQAELCADMPGLAARLLRRPGEASGMQTWMETYAIDPARNPVGIGAELQARVENPAALARFIEGPRHVEVFIALDDPL